MLVKQSITLGPTVGENDTPAVGAFAIVHPHLSFGRMILLMCQSITPMKPVLVEGNLKVGTIRLLPHLLLERTAGGAWRGGGRIAVSLGDRGTAEGSVQRLGQDRRFDFGWLATTVLLTNGWLDHRFWNGLISWQGWRSILGWTTLG